MSASRLAGCSRRYGTIAVYLGVLGILPFVMPSTPLATEVVIMTIATLSCHLLLVYGPLLSFGQGAFFGIGAYVGALYAIHADGSAFVDAGIALLLAGAAAAVVACVVGFIALRRIAGIGSHGAGGVTFLMLTFAVAQVAYFAAYNLPAFTGGENGLLGVPRPPAGFQGLLNVSLTAPMPFYVFSAVTLGVIVIAIDVAARSTIGQAFKGIRENEHRASAVGYNVFLLRVVLFTVAGLLAGVAGALYSMFLGLVPLSAIDLMQSERIVIMAVLGGTGSLIGALLGTLCFVLGSDLLSRVWPHWPMALGIAIVLIVFFARGGLWGLLDLLKTAAMAKPLDRSRS